MVEWSIVIGSYLIELIGRAMNTDVANALRQLSIFAHCNGGSILTNGIVVGGTSAIIVLGIILVGVSTQLFEHRDSAV